MKKILLLLIIQIFCAFGIAQTSGNSNIKLFRFGPVENERPAVEYPDGTRLDVSSFGEDYNEKFFAANGIIRLQNWLATNVKKCPKVALTQRFGSCVARPSKIVAIGLNYAEHVKEGTGQGAPPAIPKEPVIFLKATSALSGPFDNVVIPMNAEQVDWEVELAVIIGKKASYVSEADAMNYVAGYTVMNDYSERFWQLQKDGGQWDKGKSSDSFAPLGPYVILSQNLSNPQELNLWLKVNGKTMQQANTRDMIFNIPFLISYVSKHMTLLPGDVISTGTPSGVGNGQKPPVFLKEGDVVEFGVDNVGTLKQNVVSFIKSR
jgi:2-keto-4-pentenoate hydratase/2-oxohepta-3-ene-1,7-dioic acid hydratase in catechol pathway